MYYVRKLFSRRAQMTLKPMRQMLSRALLAGIVIHHGNLAAAVDYDDLPDMGDSASAIISPEQEKQLGESFMRQVRRQAPLVADEEVEDYIQKLGESLSTHAEYSNDFTFFVIDSPVINAFAVPGGYIGVHTGLILNSKNESEVASVLAHEVVHVTQRHGARMIEAASQLSIPTMAAMLGAMVMMAINPEMGYAAMAGFQAAQAQYQINFTRANEQEADRIGIKLLHESGFNVAAMPTFFERLQIANRYTDPKHIPEYLRSHPVTVNRIAEARDRAEKMNQRIVREDSYDYFLVRTKLDVLGAHDPAQAKQHYESILRDGNYRHEEVARYGHALALTQAGDFQRARIAFDKLLVTAPNIIAFRLGRARLEQKAGNYTAALDHYAEARALDPQSRAATYGYVQLLTETGHAEQAKQLLRRFGQPLRIDPTYFKLQAAAEEKLGEKANAHYSLAEYYRSVGELRFAAEQLRLAQTVPELTHYQRHRINARLDEVYRELDSLERDRRKQRGRDESGRRR